METKSKSKLTHQPSYLTSTISEVDENSLETKENGNETTIEEKSGLESLMSEFIREDIKSPSLGLLKIMSPDRPLRKPLAVK